jgi:hypothetical protein
MQEEGGGLCCLKPVSPGSVVHTMGGDKNVKSGIRFRVGQTSESLGCVSNSPCYGFCPSHAGKLFTYVDSKAVRKASSWCQPGTLSRASSFIASFLEELLRGLQLAGGC